MEMMIDSKEVAKKKMVEKGPVYASAPVPSGNTCLSVEPGDSQKTDVRTKHRSYSNFTRFT